MRFIASGLPLPEKGTFHPGNTFRGVLQRIILWLTHKHFSGVIRQRFLLASGSSIFLPGGPLQQVYPFTAGSGRALRQYAHKNDRISTEVTHPNHRLPKNLLTLQKIKS